MSASASTGALAAEPLLDALPCGIVMVDPDGVVLGANQTARDLLPEIDQGVERCAELLSCEHPDGPCRLGCLAARAARGAGPLPEFRVDVRGSGGPASAVWVVAAPLLHRPGAVLHLRPGEARDRRRRSEPHWLAGPWLRIRVLGQTRVDSTEGELGGAWLRQRPGQVLKLLICERHRVVTPDEVAESIWPGSGRHALSNTRHFVHRLRDKLEPGRSGHGSSSFVHGVPGGYTIDRERVWIDADAFEQEVKEGFASLQRMDTTVACEHLERALSMYGGDLFAEDPYADWAYQERDRLRALATRSLRTLVVMARERDDDEAATAHLIRLSELEPFDADVHRELLTMLLSQGRRSDARRRYTAFAARVQRDFGDEPSFDLKSLAPPGA